MKKVFISVPMKGRKKEDIERSIKMMQDVTAAYFPDGDIEFINTFVEETPPYQLPDGHSSVWYLGKSLQLLAECDLLVTLDDYLWKFSGCYVEKEVAREYNIPRLELNFKYICPDLEPETATNIAEIRH